ncbi:MAG: hypothetical protein R3E90_07995 [Marinicella sp.]
MKLTFSHIFCLISLIVAQFGDLDAYACDLHAMDMSVNSESSINLSTSHEHHNMNNDRPNQQTAAEVSGQEMSNTMACCDDCACDYAHCHNPMLMFFTVSAFDFNVTNHLNFITHIINDKNLPSHPYRPPII